MIFVHILQSLPDPSHTVLTEGIWYSEYLGLRRIQLFQVPEKEAWISQVFQDLPADHYGNGRICRFRQGLENVNKDHVAYYSYKTMMTLFNRYEYEVIEWYWCKGKPRVSEGIVFIVR